MNVRAHKKGFTIIEVVLVLAIAALIFLMIFVALPALKKGQRDTARKSEAGQIASAVTTYATNNSGRLPGVDDGDDLKNQYLDNIRQLQSVEVVTFSSNNDPEPEVEQALIIKGAKCATEGNDYLKPASDDRSAAVVVYVENGGRFCQTV